MKKKLLTLGITSLLAVSAGTIFAGNSTCCGSKASPQPIAAVATSTDLTQAADVTLDSVIKAVQTAGLANVKSVDYDNGQWEVKTQDGKTETKYTFDQHNYQLTKVGQENENDQQPTGDLSSMQNAIKAVQAKSYKVKSIDFDENCWEINAIDSTGKEYEIQVNKDDASIINSKLDD